MQWFYQMALASLECSVAAALMCTWLHHSVFPLNIEKKKVYLSLLPSCQFFLWKMVLQTVKYQTAVKS